MNIDLYADMYSVPPDERPSHLAQRAHKHGPLNIRPSEPEYAYIRETLIWYHYAQQPESDRPRLIGETYPLMQSPEGLSLDRKPAKLRPGDVTSTAEKSLIERMKEFLASSSQGSERQS